ncbi:hypothetical protein ACPYO6_13770 [Georgenia sp. Z1344]|uniref:hypothetical protein n=1 Tax=Georgenia sp. Z1344 TaxID=3416706 RepID=UPI003CEA9586
MSTTTRPPVTAGGRAKTLTYLAGIALTAVVAAPIRQNHRPDDEKVDGFPLSYYPMFSVRRTRNGTVHHLLGIDDDGTERILHFGHAGTGGLNQVRRQINRRVREGRAEEVARLVAASVAASSAEQDAAVERVQVVTSVHRFDDFFAGDRAPRRRTVLADVPVPRTMI